MRVTVHLFASLRELAGARELGLELPEGATVATAWERLAAEHPRLRELRGTILPSVNLEFAEPGRPLREGDEVAFLPPVSGGAGMFEITEKELYADPLIERMRRDTHGAVCAFVGVVRETSPLGMKVTYLEYDAYKEMAERKMRQIGDEIRSRWKLEEVAIVHRVGRLAIGETSVVIVVASPHRRDAFEACHYAIERLKQIVPIWKKEVGEHGEVWLEGEGQGREELRWPRRRR
ncbi:MAG: molybdenum cofactor biosynthesis protein MoaE [Deltaproteobacteria bacterium]|nr:molybdenum cofactor biosynthesis protein MoaE [Deltaproteobacteria bacterium]